MKKYLTRPMCLLLSAVVLAGALTAAALTGSPYETLKKAALDTIFADSGTFSIESKVYVNGQLHTDIGGRDFMQYTTDGYYSVSPNGYLNYRSGGMSLSPVAEDEDGRQWYSVTFGNYRSYTNSLASNLGLGGAERGDLSMRFMELLLDAVVGDLKNNIAMSESGGVKTIYGTLTAGQIPELYNAALSLAATSASVGRHYVHSAIWDRELPLGKSTYEETYLEGKVKTVRVYEMTVEEQSYVDHTGKKQTSRNVVEQRLISERKEDATREDYGEDVPLQSAVFDYASASVTVGADGFLSSFTGMLRVKALTIFGDTQEYEFYADAVFEDIGATVLTPPIPGLDELFTAEYVKGFFEEDGDYFEEIIDRADTAKAAWYSSSLFPYYRTLYFALLPDGTIDEASVSKWFGGDDTYLYIDDRAETVPYTMKVDEYGNTTYINEFGEEFISYEDLMQDYYARLKNAVD
jgi:hypothetical protein